VDTPAPSTWAPVAPRDRPELEAFLLSSEWSRVTFSSHLASGDFDAAYLDRSHGEVTQAVMLAPHALLLPILRVASPSLPGELIAMLPGSMTIMGSEEDVLSAERVLGRRVTRSVSYHLMKLDGPLPPAAGGTGGIASPPLRIRRASVRDLAALYPLQRDYEKEEVLLDPTMHVPRLCRAHLKLALRDQIVYLAEDSSGVLGKAGTNARGIRYDQIGGVFTVREARNRGIGRAVMRALLEELLAHKSGACLFVKKANLPAVALYRRLGFELAGGFRISYYIE
jgi:uncharacterized protein